MSRKETNYKGFLTKTDREFLRGDKEYTGEYASQQRYERRQSIRERTQGAFRDFSLLVETLDEREQAKIFRLEEDDEILQPPVELPNGEETGVSQLSRSEQQYMIKHLVDTIQFLYTGIEESRYSDFRTVLIDGVQRGEQALGRSEHQFDITVNFSIDRSPDIDLRSVFNRIERDDWPDVMQYEAARFLFEADVMDGLNYEVLERKLEKRRDLEERVAEEGREAVEKDLRAQREDDETDEE